jgi:hypothetical protein
LGALVIVVGGGLVVLLYYGPGADSTLSPIRADILKSIASSILQLTVLGVVGVAVKSEFDRYQERRKQAREDAEKAQQARNAVIELRKALLRRVLAANRVVRKAPILISAQPSAQTYSEQMRSLIDAEFEFSDIRHEIVTIPTLFSGREAIGDQLIHMERYLESLAEEYRQRYQEIVDAEETKNRLTVKSALDKLNSLQGFVQAPEGSLLRTMYLPSYRAVRDAMRQEIWGGLVQPTDEVG